MISGKPLFKIKAGDIRMNTTEDTSSKTSADNSLSKNSTG
jgi:hypothetical protein